VIPVKAIICDLDNTLWDWVSLWYAQFTALVAGVVRIGEFDREQLLNEIRAVHQKHRTSEYTALLQELPCVLDQHSIEDVGLVFKDAITDSQKARDEATTLYPGVRATLEQLNSQGCMVVAYTESMKWSSEQRLRKTGLDDLVVTLYSSPDHAFPEGVDPKELRVHDDSHYAPRVTTHKATPNGKLKPSPEILRSILADLDLSPEEAAYVGDSKMKDIRMARDVGVHDAWAAYGAMQDTVKYEFLKRVTHWTDEDVRREKEINYGPAVEPTLTLESFPELLRHFRGVDGRL
jgi:phosphoglycolate phosphatase